MCQSKKSVKDMRNGKGEEEMRGEKQEEGDMGR